MLLTKSHTKKDSCYKNCLRLKKPGTCLENQFGSCAGYFYLVIKMCTIIIENKLGKKKFFFAYKNCFNIYIFKMYGVVFNYIDSILSSLPVCL